MLFELIFNDLVLKLDSKAVGPAVVAEHKQLNMKRMQKNFNNFSQASILYRQTLPSVNSLFASVPSLSFVIINFSDSCHLFAFVVLALLKFAIWNEDFKVL